MESSSTNTSTPLFWCNICRVSCLSALNLHMHFMGAKHKKVEESLKNCGGEQLWPFSVDDISSDDEAQPGTLEEQLNACKTTTPALGLEYIYEYQPFEGGFSKYECRLCNMQSGLSSMFMHIVGAKHRISYLSKHHPGMDIPISFRAKNPAKIKKLVDACSAVENEFGRKNITVLLGSYVPASDKYSKDPRASPDIDYQKEKSQQKGKSKKQKVTFQELKKAHEANLKNPQTSADTGQCSDQDVGNCNLDEFLCNEELFDFLDHFKIKCEDDVTFVLKVTERFNKAIIIQKERHEEFKKKMAYVNPDTSSAAVVTPQTLSHIPSEEKTISNPEPGSSCTKLPPPVCQPKIKPKIPEKTCKSTNRLLSQKVSSEENAESPPVPEGQFDHENLLVTEEDQSSEEETCDMHVKTNININHTADVPILDKSTSQASKGELTITCSDNISDVRWATPDEYRQEVETDPTLNELREKAVTGELVKGRGRIEWENGLLYWVDEPSKPDLPWTSTRQLILPQKYQRALVKIAHDIPLLGHQGINHSRHLVGQAFYWPQMLFQIKDFWWKCDSCQRGEQPKLSLQDRPLTGQLFERVAVDVIGPVHQPSYSGKSYILTAVDFACRYPEAVALSTISAEAMAEALVPIFNRVGFPREIILNQDTRFMSELVRCLQQYCGMRRICTSPYDVKKNGLCESFNGTLKIILESFVDAEQDWERLLPHLLFVYKEIPQEFTGFSPFELLYGKNVRGPLCLLKEYWEGIHPHEETPIVPYIFELRHKLKALLGQKLDHEELAQRRQMVWFDKRARARECLPWKKVLAFLPTPQNMLQDAWQGPYKVVRCLGVSAYAIALDPDGQIQRSFNVNMLKEYIEHGL
ncbi:Retrovirus-related Pol poly from transposon 412 [Pelobates cultripes]|uniref:Gypsy retrotransposon integrase-like protein 1 n=1 Tax=Pelobates cultripes TaxID=61616 RepID=A0AAD1W0L1_PELCU|nr:Retrovirus-related Pol poly from transposon 412 [Pelobates cultripes]